MNILFYIITTTFLISLLAFSGALVLFFKEKFINKILLILVSFSAGALIGGAFLHLLPEAIEQVGSERGVLNIFLFSLLGFVVFFALEQFIRWHHHHKLDCSDCPKTEAFSYLILISDAVHNFIDGLIIAVSFVVSIPTGIATALAVAFHEIPQEIGDFGILVYGGIKKTKALFLNFISAITIVFGGIAGFFFAAKIGQSIVFLLPFAAGHFIYIASADLIPEIKHKDNFKKSLICFFVFILGILFMLLIRLIGE